MATIPNAGKRQVSFLVRQKDGGTVLNVNTVHGIHTYVLFRPLLCLFSRGA